MMPVATDRAETRNVRGRCPTRPPLRPSAFPAHRSRDTVAVFDQMYRPEKPPPRPRPSSTHSTHAPALGPSRQRAPTLRVSQSCARADPPARVAMLVVFGRRRALPHHCHRCRRRGPLHLRHYFLCWAGFSPRATYMASICTWYFLSSCGRLSLNVGVRQSFWIEKPCARETVGIAVLSGAISAHHQWP